MREEEPKNYNVWARRGNSWDPVLNITVSIHTAETLRALLNYEYKVPEDDYRFTVSVGKPVSYGFEPDMKTVEGKK